MLEFTTADLNRESASKRLSLALKAEDELGPGAEAVPDCGGLGIIDVHVDITSETDEGGRTNIGGEEEPLTSC